MFVELLTRAPVVLRALVLAVVLSAVGWVAVPFEAGDKPCSAAAIDAWRSPEPRASIPIWERIEGARPGACVETARRRVWTAGVVVGLAGVALVLSGLIIRRGETLPVP